MNHSEKVAAAFVAYLQSLSTWPTGFSKLKQIRAGESNLDKTGHDIVCVADDAQQEDPPFTGNCWTTVQVYQRSTAALNADRQVNPLTLHRAVAAALEDALLASDLPDLLSAALSNFVCWGVVDRVPMSDRTEDYWMAGYTLRVYSAPSDFT